MQQDDDDLLEGLGKSRQARKSEESEVQQPLSAEHIEAFAWQAKVRGANDDGDDLK